MLCRFFKLLNIVIFERLRFSKRYLPLKFTLEFKTSRMKYKIGVKLAEGINDKLIRDSLAALRKVEEEHNCQFEFYRYGEQNAITNPLASLLKPSKEKKESDDLLLSFGGAD